jgi:ankyrin repeat protein
MFNQTSVIEPLLEDRDNKGRTALHRASESGNLSQVIALLEQGAKINTEDNDWKTPLHLAAQSGEKAVVRYLLKMGADVHGADSDHQQALHLAAQRGHEEVIFCLLLGGANINARDASGQTALHNASVNGHEQVLKVLVKEGADMRIKDKDGHTAWDLAYKGGLKTAQGLLYTPGHKQMLQIQMYQRIMAKDLASLRQMLDGPLNPNFKYEWLTLLPYKGLRGLEGLTPLHFVTTPEMAKLFLDRGANVNARGPAPKERTPLHSAVCRGDCATVAVLLEGGAEVNAREKDIYRATPLHLSLGRKDYATMKVLVEGGADANAKIHCQNGKEVTAAATAKAQGVGDILKRPRAAQGSLRGLPVRQPGGQSEVSYPYSLGGGSMLCRMGGRAAIFILVFIFSFPMGIELTRNACVV